MKIHSLLIAATVFGAVALTSVIAEKSAGPTTRPAAKVAATVGKATITSQQIQQARQGMARQTGRMPTKQQALDQLVTQELMKCHAMTMPCSDKDVKAWKAETQVELTKRNLGSIDKFMADRKITEEDVKLIVRFKNLEKQAEKEVASDKAVTAFTKANPSYFDGTKVQASHILLSCGQGYSDKERGAIRKKLEQIVADVKAGKVKFAEAALKHSTCPSKAKGGDLGEFVFHRMVPPFAQTAFGMKIGDISGVVETQFGYHVITVTKRIKGTGKPGAIAPQVAKGTLMANYQNKIITNARTINPVSIIK